MPEIAGLKEMQDALKRVKKNLDDIKDINDFIQGVADCSKDGSVAVTYDISIAFGSGNEAKRFKSPISVQDNRYILDAAQRYKDAIVAKVKEDSSLYNIALTPQEDELLAWVLFEE